MCGAERDGAKAAAERSAVPALRLLPTVFSFCLGGGEKRVFLRKRCLWTRKLRRAALRSADESKGNGAAPRLCRSRLCLHRSPLGRGEERDLAPGGLPPFAALSADTSPAAEFASSPRPAALCHGAAVQGEWREGSWHLSDTQLVAEACFVQPGLRKEKGKNETSCGENK